MDLERQAAAIAAWCGVFVRPGDVCELRARGVPGDGIVNGYFTGDRLADLGRAAAALDARRAAAVYLTFNPVDSGRLAVRTNVTGICRTGEGTAAEHIQSLRWLMVDIDPIRPADASATAAERAGGWEVLARCLSVLSEAGLRGPVVAESGNGWHLFYPIALPNDAPSIALLKGLLASLSTRCSDTAAAVDAQTYKPNSMAKCYGTRARKGPSTPERPCRFSRLCDKEYLPPSHAEQDSFATSNTEALRGLLRRWDYQDRVRGHADMASKNGDHDPARLRAYAQAALRKESDLVATAEPHNWNRQCNKSAYSLAQLAASGLLARIEVEQALTEASRQRGHEGPEVTATIRSGIEAGLKKPRMPETNGHAASSAETVVDLQLPPPAAGGAVRRVATAADLIRHQVTIRWLWEGWIPLGALTILAAEPGCGKTRMASDLLRRLYLASQGRADGVWPDGKPIALPVGLQPVALWVAADNQHPELGTFPSTFGFPAESLYLNAPVEAPFGGTMLDSPEDLKEFEANIAAVRPALVFIDTSLNATDKTSHKPEDAKAFFKPLAEIAQRQATSIVCVTHLNAGGKPLGRRIEGQGRVVIMLEKPDPDQEHRRKLWVKKSHSIVPPALGVTMGADGNTYDNDPPKPSSSEPGNGQHSGGDSRLNACCEWLRQRLEGGSARVVDVRGEAEAAGFNAKLLYRARDRLGVNELELQSRKWWQLAPDEYAP